MTDKKMTIREMCDTFEVTPRTLRFYESKELLSPIREGTKRLYTRRERARLKLIQRGKRFGFSLEEIRQLLELYQLENRNRLQIETSLKMAAEHLETLESQRAEMDTTIDELQALMQRNRDLLKRHPSENQT